MDILSLVVLKTCKGFFFFQQQHNQSICSSLFRTFAAEAVISRMVCSLLIDCLINGWLCPSGWIMVCVYVARQEEGRTDRSSVVSGAFAVGVAAAES